MSRFNLLGWPARVGTAISQLFNALLNGNEDESFSSRSWKAKARGKLWGRIAVPVVDFVFGKGHCRTAAEWDEA